VSNRKVFLLVNAANKNKVFLPNYFIETPLCFHRDNYYLFTNFVLNDINNDVIVILIGRAFYNRSKINQENLSAIYSDKGIDAIKQFEGHYSIVIIDKVKQIFLFFTDITNTHKIFYFNPSKNNFYISNTIWTINVCEHYVNKSMAIMYLINGSTYNNKTLISGIKSFDYGSFITYNENNTFTFEKYWEFSSSNNKKISVQEYKENILALIKDSIKQNVKDYSNLFVSLSGGYDASTILAFINEIANNPNIKNISYYYNSQKGKLDCDVAKSQSELFANQFFSYPAYDKNVIDINEIFKLNAVWGEGVANFCEEIAFLKEVNKIVESTNNCLFFYGDEIMGISKAFIRNTKNIPNVYRIKNCETINELQAFFDPKQISDFKNIFKPEFDILINSVSNEKTNYDKLAAFYYKNRLSNILVNWRYYFSSRYTDFSLPFLSRSVIESVNTLHPQNKYFKKSFIHAVSQKFPQQFSIKRPPTNNVTTNWTALFIENKTTLLEYITALHSDFDNFFSLDILQLFKELNNNNNKYILKINNLNRKMRRVSPLYLDFLIKDKLNFTQLLKNYILLKTFYNFWENKNTDEEIWRKYFEK